MIEKPLPDPLFHPPGRAHDKVAPAESEDADKNGRKENVAAMAKQGGACDGKGCDPVNRPFDDPRDKELENIHQEQGK